MVDIAYTPIFESGGKYTLKLSGVSNDEHMHYGVIICQTGARYASYCANAARTYFVNPTKEKEEKYAAIFEAHSAAISALVEGSKASAAYEASLQVLKDKCGEEILSKMPKNVGTAIGLEIRDNSQPLSQSNDAVLKAGMTFNVTLGKSMHSTGETKVV